MNTKPFKFWCKWRYTIFYVTVATMISSHVKITCYFHVWRYHGFARKVNWYFTAVYIINILIPLPFHYQQSLLHQQPWVHLLVLAHCCSWTMEAPWWSELLSAPLIAESNSSCARSQLAAIWFPVDRSHYMYYFFQCHPRNVLWLSPVKDIRVHNNEH